MHADMPACLYTFLELVIAFRNEVKVMILILFSRALFASVARATNKQASG